MSTDRLKGLRIQVMVILVLLILQFELGMAANFILSLVFYFMELYFLKPAPKTQPS
jgi:hypothetical protein